MEPIQPGESSQWESRNCKSDDYISLEALKEVGIDRSELERRGVQILDGLSEPCVWQKELEDRLPAGRRPE
jgi:hypothetical protein